MDSYFTFAFFIINNGQSYVDYRILYSPDLFKYIYIVTLNFVFKTTNKTAVNGGFGPWTEWTPCDKTCGQGEQIRERACNKPAPSGGGKSCNSIGSYSEVKKCQIAQCGMNQSYFNAHNDVYNTLDRV